MRNRRAKPIRLDTVLLWIAAVLLLPVLVVALAPVLLTLLVLWPVLALPVLAVPRTLPIEDSPRGKSRRPAVELDPSRDLPQAA